MSAQSLCGLRTGLRQNSAAAPETDLPCSSLLADPFRSRCWSDNLVPVCTRPHRLVRMEKQHRRTHFAVLSGIMHSGTNYHYYVLNMYWALFFGHRHDFYFMTSKGDVLFNSNIHPSHFYTVIISS